MWVGWLIPKQGPNPFFDPYFTFRFPKSHKNPGVGGWVNRFGKTFSFLLLPYKDKDRKRAARTAKHKEFQGFSKNSP